jgi:hypothetical protein
MFNIVAYKLLKWGNDDSADEGSRSTQGRNIRSNCSNSKEQLSEGILSNLACLSNFILFPIYLIM